MSTNGYVQRVSQEARLGLYPAIDSPLDMQRYSHLRKAIRGQALFLWLVDGTSKEVRNSVMTRATLWWVAITD